MECGKMKLNGVFFLCVVIKTGVFMMAVNHCGC